MSKETKKKDLKVEELAKDMIEHAKKHHIPMKKIKSKKKKS